MAGKLAWKDLGKELIPNDDTALGVIAVNANGDVITCCESLFKVWLERQPEASWRQLIGALKEIKQGTLATQIEEMLEPSTTAASQKGMIAIHVPYVLMYIIIAINM